MFYRVTCTFQDYDVVHIFPVLICIFWTHFVCVMECISTFLMSGIKFCICQYIISKIHVDIINMIGLLLYLVMTKYILIYIYLFNVMDLMDCDYFYAYYFGLRLYGSYVYLSYCLGSFNGSRMISRT